MNRCVCSLYSCKTPIDITKLGDINDESRISEQTQEYCTRVVAPQPKQLEEEDSVEEENNDQNPERQALK